MDLTQIIDRLVHYETLPKRAIQTSLAHPEEVVPELLAILKRGADPANAGEEDLDALVLLIHILAELRETRAFQPLMDLLTLDSDHIERALGDVVTETLSQVLISTFDGDTERLYRLIGDGDADEFVRDAVLRVWTYLVLTEKIDRATAHRYLAGFPDKVGGANGDHIWVSWVETISSLGFTELTDTVKAAFSDGRICRDILGALPMEFYDFEQDLAEALTTSDREGWMRRNRYWPFEDTIGTLSQWYGFSEEYARRRRERIANAPYTLPHGFEMATNPYRSVGRNDPCPCGSGKKFKKCCLQ